MKTKEIMQLREEIMEMTDIPKNFKRFHISKIQEIVEYYDSICFNNEILSNSIVTIQSATKRMTRCAGNIRGRYLGDSNYKYDFTIQFSPVVFQNAFSRFTSHIVNGIETFSRLEALLLVLEHELIHALEHLRYGKTGHGKNFKRLAKKYFNHTGVYHALPTKGSIEYEERMMRDRLVANASKKSIEKGDKVYFYHKRTKVTGQVTNIRKRATVTTKEYSTYYVPLSRLELV